MRHESQVTSSRLVQRPAPGKHYSRVMHDADPAGDTFAGLIATARRAKGWSQEDLERHSGVSRSTLSRWERGLADRPEPDHVRAVCKALDIDPRRIAVALGYLTEEEVADTPRQLPPEIEQVLDILQDPSVPEEEKKPWVAYLVYLHDKAKQQRQAS